MLPQALQKWAVPIEPALRRLLIPNRVAKAVESSRQRTGAADFARGVLEFLKIRFAVDESDLSRIPAKGPAVVVSNHPFGIVEGLLLAVILDRVRPDWKILANSMLAGVEEFRAGMIPVNPFETPESRKQNLAPLRQAREWLARGGVLTIFPAGEVASLDWRDRAVADPPWKTTAARLAIRAQCPVIPMFFMGANSMGFQLAGALHPALRTLSLARELERLSGKTIRLRIGHVIPANVLAACGTPEQATAYLRSRATLLAHRPEPRVVTTAPAPGEPVRDSIMPPADRRAISEIAALPPDCTLADTGDFAVYLAPAAAIPYLLEEIGRAREGAFREAGEGTGSEADLDRFDRYYQHLILWSKADSRLAGAYRLAVTTDILDRHGVAGLYTSTLFRYESAFFEALGPAVELGRSFVVSKYQKNYASLLLLWKGITRAVLRRPEAPVLFGAVSISNRYEPASRGLIVNYLSSHASHDLGRLVRPRRRFQHSIVRDRDVRRIASIAADVEDVSAAISDIERDSKGVPVLLRQYLKAGGRLLGFNVDPKFSNVLDALIATDLRDAPLPLLERCMGRSEARAFLASHGRGGEHAA
jgi:putative hemolysin